MRATENEIGYAHAAAALATELADQANDYSSDHPFEEFGWHYRATDDIGNGWPGLVDWIGDAAMIFEREWKQAKEQEPDFILSIERYAEWIIESSLQEIFNLPSDACLQEKAAEIIAATLRPMVTHG